MDISKIIFLGALGVAYCFFIFVPSRQILQTHDAIIRRGVGLALLALIVLWGPLFSIGWIFTYGRQAASGAWHFPIYVTLWMPSVLVVYRLVTLREYFSRKLRLCSNPPPDIVVKVRELSKQIGLKRAPEVELSEMWNMPPQVFGIFGQYTLVIPKHFRWDLTLISGRDTNAPAYLEDFVLRHELAHIRQRDAGFVSLAVALTGSLAISNLILILLLIAYRLSPIAHDTATWQLLSLIWPMAILSIEALLFFYLVFKSLSHRREFLADALASLFTPQRQANYLLKRVSTWKSEPASFFERLLNFWSVMHRDPKGEKKKDASRRLKHKRTQLCRALPKLVFRNIFSREILASGHPSPLLRHEALVRGRYIQTTSLTPEWQCVAQTAVCTALLLVVLYHFIPLLGLISKGTSSKDMVTETMAGVAFWIFSYPAFLFAFPARQTAHLSITLRVLKEVAIKCTIYIFIYASSLFALLSVDALFCQRPIMFQYGLKMTVVGALVFCTLFPILFMFSVSGVFKRSSFLRRTAAYVIGAIVALVIPLVAVSYPLLRNGAPLTDGGIYIACFLMPVLLASVIILDATYYEGLSLTIGLGARKKTFYETYTRETHLFHSKDWFFLSIVIYSGLVGVTTGLVCLLSKPLLWDAWRECQSKEEICLAVAFGICAIGVKFAAIRKRLFGSREWEPIGELLQPLVEFFPVEDWKWLLEADFNSIKKKIAHDFQNADGGIPFVRPGPSYLNASVEFLFGIKQIGDIPSEYKNVLDFVMQCYSGKGFGLAPGVAPNLSSTFQGVLAAKKSGRAEELDLQAIETWCRDRISEKGYFGHGREWKRRLQDTFSGVACLYILAGGTPANLETTKDWLLRQVSVAMRSSAQNVYRALTALFLLDALDEMLGGQVARMYLLPRMADILKLPADRHFIEIAYAVSLFDIVKPFLGEENRDWDAKETLIMRRLQDGFVTVVERLLR